MQATPPIGLLAAAVVCSMFVCPKGASAHGSHKHTNLKVLADTKASTGRAMKDLSKGLGVKCTFCHVKGALDRDDKAHKVATRAYLKAVLTDARDHTGALQELLRSLGLAKPKRPERIRRAVELWKDGLNKKSRSRIRTIDTPAPKGARYPSLDFERGRLHMSWLEPASKAGFRVRVSTRAHRRWTDVQTIAESKKLFANWADFPSITEDSNGKLFAHWPQKSGAAKYAYDVRIACRFGRRWMPIGTLHDDGTETEHGFASFVREGAGLRAFWLDGRQMADHPPGPMTLRTALVDERIHSSEVLDERVCECCGTDATVSDGGPLVVYRDRSGEEIRDIMITRRRDGRWTPPKKIHNDAWKIVGCPVNGPSVAAKGRRVAVAWFTGASDRGRVRVAFSDDDGATFSKPAEIGMQDDLQPLGRVDIQLSELDAIVSWLAPVDDVRAQVRVARVQGRSVGRPVTVATTRASRSSGFARTALGASRLFVAWTDPKPVFRVRLAELALAQIPRAGPKATPTRTYARSPLVLTASTLDGQPRSLDARPTLLNLWATWCAPCRKEFPVLAKIHGRYARSGLRVVGVSIDGRGKEGTVRRFANEVSAPYEIWWDPDNRSSVSLGSSALPTTVLLDRQRRIVWRAAGVVKVDDATLHSAIEKVLGASSED